VVARGDFLSVGQIYLLSNPLLTEPLRPENVKPRLLGHWGTTPGLNMIYVHLNRVIRNQDLNVIYVTGPGHGGPGIVANTYLEGTYSELYPYITPDAVGMGRLFKQFSFPGGDGESETGPLAGSWHRNKFLDPARDGAVLPILHLNGYKIANPTVPARIPHAELESLLRGYGYAVHTVEGDEPKLVHQQLAGTLDAVIEEIRGIQRRARSEGDLSRPAWPVIILKTPKGWTGPKVVDGLPVEGTWRAHQVPLDAARTNPEHLAQLETWMRSYQAEELFDGSGALVPELAKLAPVGDRRMSANPHANGGLLLRELTLPDFQVEVPTPGGSTAEATRVLGTWLRDVIKANPSNFRAGWRVHRPRSEQEGRSHPGLPAAGRELPAVHGGPLPALPAVRERHRGRQAAAGAVADHGRGDHPLHPGSGNLGVGLQRRPRRTRRGDGVLRRHPDAGDAGRGLAAAHAPAVVEAAGRERRGPEGTTTTPFDMVMLNDLDRFHLVMDVIDRVPGLASTAGHVRQLMVDKRITCRASTRQEGQDAPEITNWSWPR
jgi:phosphoketolase